LVCKFRKGIEGKMDDNDKLEELAEIEGFIGASELIEYYVFKSVVPGICMNPLCNTTMDVESDQEQGWCSECEANTIKSCLVLGELF
jgi:hypothetical protein